MATMNHSIRRNEWVISYSQNDVDTIRVQVEQTEAMKRRWLIIALAVALIALVGAVMLLSTNRLQYSSVSADKERLSQENVALKGRADQAQQQRDHHQNRSPPHCGWPTHAVRPWRHAESV